MGKISKTIQILVTAGIWAGAVVLVTGCDETTPKPSQTNTGIRGDVTDVRPMEPATPAAYAPPVYDTTAVIPTAPQAVTADTVAATSVTPMMSTTPSSSDSGKTHTVRHGETLFSIAKASYGDGKAWKKIVSANPGVSPSKLKVGQVLAMP